MGVRPNVSHFLGREQERVGAWGYVGPGAGLVRPAQLWAASPLGADPVERLHPGQSLLPGPQCELEAQGVRCCFGKGLCHS